MATKDQLAIYTEMGWSTHMPVLLKLVSLTKGPIMELGSGIYSTPLLHWLCDKTKRELITYENDENFIKYAKGFESENHKVQLVDDYLTIPNTDRFSLILIDHSGHSRGKTALHFKDSADYIVIHDSNVVGKNMYQVAFPEFKYRKDYDLYIPWTSVLSNSQNLEGLW